MASILLIVTLQEVGVVDNIQNKGPVILTGSFLGRQGKYLHGLGLWNFTDDVAARVNLSVRVLFRDQICAAGAVLPKDYIPFMPEVMFFDEVQRFFRLLKIPMEAPENFGQPRL